MAHTQERTVSSVEDVRIDKIKDRGNMPRHVAIIMDGNGRWAKRKKLPRIYGHRKGVKVVRPVVTTAAKLGIDVLTLYAFSTENWSRPKREISSLMKLLREYLRKEAEELKKNNVRLQTVGHTGDLTGSSFQELLDVMDFTAQCTGLILNLALSYSGRVEIVDAVRAVARDVKAGRIDEETIDVETFSRYLYTRDYPDPDLLIRTSGEYRVSNFLLWQIAYSEIWVTETYWPDFGPGEFLDAIESFQMRERRFGGV